MKKALPIISLIIIAVLGSFVNFYGMNYIFSDISNMFYGVHDYNFVASIPMFIIVLDFVFLMIYAYRFIKKPQFRKASTKTYLIIFWVLSIIGVMTDIVSGIKIYGSFTKPYPFPGAMIIFLVFHLLVLFGCAIGYYFAETKMKDDDGNRKITFKNSLFTVLLFLMILLAFNRFGAFIWSPSFIHLRTLYLTWPFYLGLLAPMAQLVHTYLYTFPEFKTKPKIGLTYAWILFALVVVSNVYTIIVGYFNTTFISVISPMLALERLATLPIDVIIIFIIMFIYSITSLFYSMRWVKKSLKNKEQA